MMDTSCWLKAGQQAHNLMLACCRTLLQSPETKQAAGQILSYKGGLMFPSSVLVCTNLER